MATLLPVASPIAALHSASALASAVDVGVGAVFVVVTGTLGPALGAALAADAGLAGVSWATVVALLGTNASPASCVSAVVSGLRVSMTAATTPITPTTPTPARIGPALLFFAPVVGGGAPITCPLPVGTCCCGPVG